MCTNCTTSGVGCGATVVLEGATERAPVNLEVASDISQIISEDPKGRAPRVQEILWKCKWWCTSDFRSCKRSCTSSYFERCSWSLFSINVKLISDTTDFPLSSSKCPRLSKFLYSLLFNCSKYVLHHWPWKRRPYDLDYRTFLETMISFTNIVCFTISSERFVRFWPKFGQHINYLKHLYSYDFRLVQAFVVWTTTK